MVVYHLPKHSGNLGRNVNGKILLFLPEQKTGFLKGRQNFPTGISEYKMKMSVPFASFH